MTDFNRRVKTIEKRLGIGGREGETIIIKPLPAINANCTGLNKMFPRLDGESDADYLERVNNAPEDESKLLPAETVTYPDGSTLTLPRRLRPEFEDLI